MGWDDWGVEGEFFGEEKGKLEFREGLEEVGCSRDEIGSWGKQRAESTFRRRIFLVFCGILI